MATATAVASMATTLAVAAAKAMAATAMVGGTDNNQLKVTAEEMAAEATETAMAMEIATRRHS
jgi:hypothetical protein